MNRTQEFFLFNSRAQPVIRKIVDLFHYDLSNGEKGRVKATAIYDCVCLDSDKVSLIIRFHHNLSLPRVTIADFDEVYMTASFTAVRSVRDSRYVPRDFNANKPKLSKSYDIIAEALNHIMKDVPKPTPYEMYIYYESLV